MNKITRLSFFHGIQTALVIITLAGMSVFSHAAFIPVIEGDVEVGNASRPVSHVVKFNVDKIPEDPKLIVKFKVKSTGSCSSTYSATAFFLNGDNFAQVDFRKLKLGEDKEITLKVPEDTLVAGENKLEIMTGDCQFGVDSMTMNSIYLN